MQPVDLGGEPVPLGVRLGSAARLVGKELPEPGGLVLGGVELVDELVVGWDAADPALGDLDASTVGTYLGRLTKAGRIVQASCDAPSS